MLTRNKLRQEEAKVSSKPVDKTKAIKKKEESHQLALKPVKKRCNDISEKQFTLPFLMGTNYVNLESFKLRQTQKGGDTFFTFGDLLKAKSLVSNACSINKIIVYSKHRRAGFFEVHSYQTHGTLAILRRVLCIKNFDLTPCSPKLALTLTK